VFNIWNPCLFSGTPEMVLIDYFLGVGLTIFLPMLVICLVMMLTMRS